MAHRSGWFSDRTECYLAAGRPALVQDTGWSATCRTARACCAFSTPDEALDGLEPHCRRLRAPRGGAPPSIAADCFDAGRVLPRLLETAGAMTPPLRIAQVAPVATSVPPPRSGSIESLTALLTDGLVARGHDVTLFATGESRTRAALHATFARGYREDPENWPWELCELINLAAAVERAPRHSTSSTTRRSTTRSRSPFARLAGVPLVVRPCTIRPDASEVALWARHYPDTPFVAVSQAQARSMAGLNVVGDRAARHRRGGVSLSRRSRDDYLLFLGRFTEGKGVLQAIDVARRAGHAARAGGRSQRLLP